MPIYLYICLYIHLSKSLFIDPAMQSVHIPMYLCIYLSIYLSMYNQWMKKLMQFLATQIGHVVHVVAAAGATPDTERRQVPTFKVVTCEQ